MDQRVLNDSSIDGDLLKVLVNSEQQYSLWPAAKMIPKGWSEQGFTGSNTECVSYIDQLWRDMRPLTSQKQMAPTLHPHEPERS
jgi:MbtH protein